MKNKSDLKRKVLCSLLAASTMGIFYSSNALAADLPVDHILVNGSQENSENVGNLVAGDKSYIYGVTGGNTYLDRQTWNNIMLANIVISGEAQNNHQLEDVANLVGDISTLVQNNTITISDGNPAINNTTNGLYLQNYGKQDNVVRYYGAIGGDILINANLNINEPGKTSVSAETGSRDNQIIGGSVIGGVGGSAAVGIGNISASVSNSINITTGGEAHATINGNVETTQGKEANVIGMMNGGLAAGIGSTATSTVTGNTVYTLDGTGRADHGGDYEKPGENDILPQLTTALNIMEGSKINAIGVAGGGTAVTTLGGTAASNVNGTTTININNATVLGAIGGGIAGAVDATGVAEAIIDPSKQYGNNDGTSGFGIGMDADGNLSILTGSEEENALIKVEGAQVNEGGKATATTGDTNINLNGNTTAVGVVGGGIAAASHTYTVKPENEGGTLPEGYEVNDEYGKSEATATTGKSHITIALDSSKLDGAAKSAMLSNVSSFKNKLVNNTGDLQADELKDLANKGAAVGVFGGGVAVSHSGNRNNMDNKGLNDQGAFAVANTAGSDINLDSGYAAGVFGGGVAAAMNNSSAASNMTEAVNINVGKDMEAVGVFGNGFAYYTGSYRTSTGERAYLEGTANVTAQDTNINVAGKVDGIVNGGLAIDDSEADTTNAMVRTENGTINIYDGAEVNTIEFSGFTGIVGNVPQDDIDMASYVAGVKDAAENVAIAAGGVAVGGGAESTVANAQVNILGGTVNGDVIGGGVGAYGYTESDGVTNGANVETSTLNLYGGTINGNVYAGGSASANDASNKGYTEAQATVNNSTINLAGATVTGVLTGKGVSGGDSDKALNSIMNVSGENTLGLVDDNGTKVSKINGFNKTNFTADSVTTLDSSLTAGNTVALIDAKLSDTENGVITVANGAKLDVSQLKTDKDNAYLVASNYAANSTLWDNSALAYDRTENYAQAIEDSAGYKVSYKDLEDLTEEEQNQAVNDFKDSLGEGGDNFDGIANGIIRNGDNTYSGAKNFFRDYTSGNGTTRDLAAMAMIGEAAGVTSNSISVAGDMADNSVLRLSFTQDDITGEPKVNEDGAIWAKYIHNKHDLDDMASSFGSINSSSDFDGVTVGVDFAKKGKVQSGIAFSYGDGDSHGMGINNDFDMWGVTLYGNVKNDDTNVIADIGFSESDNELTGNAMGKRIKADRDVSVFTVGVRAEKLYTNGSTQIVPYTGLRYYNVDPDSYTAYYDGQKFGEYDADRQNIWTLPLGVSLRNETVTENGWRLTPKVDVAYIWAFGDTDNSFDLNTGSGADSFEYTVMDSGSWLGSVGFEAGKGDWNFGLGYTYQKGSHAEANKWFVNAEYSF